MKSGGKVSWEVAISKIELGIYENFCLVGPQPRTLMDT